MDKKKLPISFKFALLLFFISLQCFLGALFLKEREGYYKLESKLVVSEEAVVREAPLETARPSTAIGLNEAESGKDTGLITEASTLSSEVVLSEALKVRKRGTLWFDRQSDSYIITIGKKNGIKAGDTLEIYDSGEVIGQTKVVRPMEKISIVEIDDIIKKKLTKTYYKVSYK